MATKLKMIILVATLLASIIAHIPQTQAVHHTDCMKNPFASGCRGISAKRASWPFAGPASPAGAAPERQQTPANYLIDGDEAASSVRSAPSWPTAAAAAARQTQLPAGPPVWRHSATSLGAAELLIAAANRLLREPLDTYLGGDHSQRAE